MKKPKLEDIFKNQVLLKDAISLQNVNNDLLNGSINALQSIVGAQRDRISHQQHLINLLENKIEDGTNKYTYIISGAALAVATAAFITAIL